MQTMMVHNIKPNQCRTCRTAEHLEVKLRNRSFKVHCGGCGGVGYGDATSSGSIQKWNQQMKGK